MPISSNNNLPGLKTAHNDWRTHFYLNLCRYTICFTQEMVLLAVAESKEWSFLNVAFVAANQ